MRLTLCIATYNEEKNIRILLDSTIDWVDEVVIVDGGSTDKTLDILRSYGNKVKIINTDNHSMFHINKQKAIEAASGQWILQLDADEEVTSELREEILEIVFSRQSSVVSKECKENGGRSGSCPPTTGDYLAYQIPRRNFFLGRPLMKGGVYPDYTIRLYKKGMMYFPCKDVHENVTPVVSRPFGFAQDKQSSVVSCQRLVEGLGNPSTEFTVSPSAMFGINSVEWLRVNREQSQWLGTLQHPMNHYSDPDFGRYLARWGRYTSAEAKRVLGEAKKLYGDDEKKLLEWQILFLMKAFFLLPPYWFAKTYIRHKGFLDGWQGFVFHLMSAIRWWGIGGKVVKFRPEADQPMAE